MKRLKTLLVGLSIFFTTALFAQTIGSSTETKLSLDGTWHFNPAPKNDWQKSNNQTDWNTIEVPGEWVMLGYSVELGKEAAYTKEFTIPTDWSNSIIYLRCDAVFSKANIWINGQEIGTHIGPFIAFEKEITASIKPGKTNQIAIGITAETLADTLMSGTQYAAHQIGGILRKIYVYAVPKVHLKNIAIETDFDNDYKNATLKINGLLLNRAKSDSTSIQFSLIDPKGNKVELKNDTKGFFLKKNETKKINLSFNVNNPLKWDAEHPNLYQLVMDVNSSAGNQKITKNIGFREIKVEGNQLFVNGAPIKLKGVNRHEAHPLLGRSLNSKLWKQDALLYKEANINYIRTSHYPPSEEFIEWCDKLGLYVELENPLCWIGHGANANWQQDDPHKEEIYEYMEDISGANIQFFGNHPSIIIWSMANESAWGPNWEKLANFYAKTDPSRPATFHDQTYGGFNNFGSTAMPIANYHYPGPKGPEIANDYPRPLLYGEFAHLNTYNRTEIVTDPGVRDSWGRGFYNMWESMYQSQGCLGGAIWSGIDDVFYLPDGRTVGYGEWGPIDGWRRKKPEYYHIKNTYSPVKILTKKIATPSNGKGITIKFENRFDFTNLNECTINWSLENESDQIIIELPPHQSGEITIYPKTKNLDGELLNIEVTSPQGFNVASVVIEIGNVKRDNFPFIKTTSKNLTASEKGNIVSIQSANFSWDFDLTQGKLVSAKSGNTKVLTGGAELMILELTTGATKTEHSLDIPFHNDVCTNWLVKSSKWKFENNTVIIKVKASYNEAKGEIQYVFTNDGVLKVNYNLTSKIKVDPRQWGMVFSSPTEIKNLQWYRKALWSSYPEDHIGRTVGSAIPFEENSPSTLIREEPTNAWRFDSNKLGSNDFRSTRENIYWSALTNDKGIGLTVISDGKQAFRSFVSGEKISFLVADYSTGGGDSFFRTHYDAERKNLKKGSKIEGTITIQLVNGKKN